MSGLLACVYAGAPCVCLVLEEGATPLKLELWVNAGDGPGSGSSERAPRTFKPKPSPLPLLLQSLPTDLVSTGEGRSGRRLRAALHQESEPTPRA